MAPSTICITGGAGFIGSHLADALCARGHRVLVLDDLSSGRREHVPPGAELAVLDVRSEAAAALVAERNIEVLFHLAAQMDIRKSIADPAFDADVNIRGALNVVEAGRRAGLRHVVFASSAGVYGEQEAFPAAEDHPTRPVSPYGVAKLAVEQYLGVFRLQYGLDASCLRFANVYGPRQSVQGEAGVVAVFAEKLLAGRPCTIRGDGEQTRDFVYVGDVVAALAAMLGRQGYEIFNVGTGVETTVNALAEHMRAVTGSSVASVHGPAHHGEQRRSSLSASKLEAATGLRSATLLAAGLGPTLAWFRSRAR